MEFTETGYKYLRRCNIKLSRRFLFQRMLSHPYYPSLLSFTDTLDELQLSYIAIVAGEEQIKDLKYPILAHFSNNGVENFRVIQSSKFLPSNDTAQLRHWDGVAVIVQPNGQIFNKEHNTLLKNDTRNSRLNYIVTALIASIFIFYLFIYSSSSYILLAILNLIGVFICALILMHSLGKDNVITEHLCKTDNIRGCDSVLNSPAGKFSKIFGLADVGLTYFMGLFFVSELAATTINGFYGLLLFFTCSISCVVSLLSIYYQWRVLKNWCTMCLLVIGVTWIDEILITQVYHIAVSLHIQKFDSQATILFLFCLLFPATIWFFFKPFLLKSYELDKIGSLTLKWKRNPDLFLGLLHRQRRIDITLWPDDILLGNFAAPLLLTAVVNPYCGPCARAHLELEKIVNMFPEQICILIRFSLNASNKQDKRRIAVDQLLNTSYYHSEKGKQGDKIHLLNAWFEKMDLAKFEQEFALPSQRIDYSNLLMRYDQWCKEANITHTPSFFVNGYELVNPYAINDISFLLNYIIESIPTRYDVRHYSEPNLII